MYWVSQYFSRPQNHFWAAFEVVITAIFSMAPFVITFLVQSSKMTDGSFSDFAAIVGRGQIYLLAYGIFGPILWLSFINPKTPRHNARVMIGVLSLIALLPVVGFLGVDPTFESIQNVRVIKWSYWFYGGLLFLNYLAIFYCDIAPPEANDILGRETDTMRKAYEELSGNE